MRAVKTVIAIWLLCALAIWIRDGRGFCVLDALPFVERQESFSPDYEWLVLAALMIGMWGYLMLTRQKGGQQGQDGKRFRSAILLVPATIIGLALLTQRVTPALSFAEVVGDSHKLVGNRSAVCNARPGRKMLR